MENVSSGFETAINQPGRQISSYIAIDNGITNNPTFTRNSIAYTSDGEQVAANTPRFEQGRFGQAIMVEEGTTNLLTANQSSVETDLTGFTAIRNATLSRDATKSWHGSASLRVTTPGLQNDEGVAITYSASLSAGQVFNYSVYLAGTGTVWLAILEYGSTLNNRQHIIANLSSEFKRYDMTYTVTATATKLELRVVTNIVEAVTFWVDGIQLEAKPYATSFIDGTRSPETLTIPTAGVLNPQEGTIEFWWNPLAKTPQTYPSLISTGQWTSPITLDWLSICWGSGWSNANTVAFAMYNKNGTSNFNMSVALNPQPYTWYYVAAKWSFVTRIAKLIIYRPDGTYVSTQATINGEPPTFEGWDKFYILQTWNNGAHRANSLIDDLRISNRARTDAEIAEAYASGQLLPTDEHTTYKLNFDDNINNSLVYNDSYII